MSKKDAVNVSLPTIVMQHAKLRIIGTIKTSALENVTRFLKVIRQRGGVKKSMTISFHRLNFAPISCPMFLKQGNII